jgi:hypothetical protein
VPGFKEDGDGNEEETRKQLFLAMFCIDIYEHWLALEGLEGLEGLEAVSNYNESLTQEKYFF